MRILQTTNEQTINQIIWLLNRISTIEDRYEVDENTTSSIINYYKHPTQDVWFFHYDLVLPHMGVKGKEICELLETTIKADIFTFVEYIDQDDLISKGYFNTP